MTYHGRVEGGVIVLEGAIQLPEGAIVRVQLVPATSPDLPTPVQEMTLGQKLLKYAGKAVGLPPDAARNHDHYLYGGPKK